MKSNKPIIDVTIARKHILRKKIKHFAALKSGKNTHKEGLQNCTLFSFLYYYVFPLTMKHGSYPLTIGSMRLLVPKAATQFSLFPLPEIAATLKQQI